MEDSSNIHYYLTYNEVIAKAQAIQPYFAADLAKFNDFDPWYTSAVNTELVSGIYIGLKYFSENSLVGDIKRVTDLLETCHVAAIQCYEELNNYVVSAFEDDLESLEAFGHAEFEKAHHSVKKMVALLNRAHFSISQGLHQSRLLAQGMPPGMVLEIANLAAELAAMYGELKILKKQHLLATRERINLFNSLWDTLSEICEDAKIIFADDPQHLEFYDLYDTEGWNVDQLEYLAMN